MKFNIKSSLIFLLGILIMTLGVSLTVKSEIGAGAYDSINFGLAKLFKYKCLNSNMDNIIYCCCYSINNTKKVSKINYICNCYNSRNFY